MNLKFPVSNGRPNTRDNTEIDKSKQGPQRRDIKNLGRKQDFRNEFEDTGRSPFIRFL